MGNNQIEPLPMLLSSVVLCNPTYIITDRSFSTNIYFGSHLVAANFVVLTTPKPMSFGGTVG